MTQAQRMQGMNHAVDVERLITEGIKDQRSRKLECLLRHDFVPGTNDDLVEPGL